MGQTIQGLVEEEAGLQLVEAFDLGEVLGRGLKSYSQLLGGGAQLVGRRQQLEHPKHIVVVIAEQADPLSKTVQ